MPEFFDRSKQSMKYPQYYERIVEILKLRAMQGNYIRYYYGIFDDVEGIRNILQKVVDEIGPYSAFTYRRSCASESTDLEELVTVSLNYPDSTHTITYVAQRDTPDWNSAMEGLRLHMLVSNR